MNCARIVVMSLWYPVSDYGYKQKRFLVLVPHVMYKCKFLL